MTTTNNVVNKDSKSSNKEPTKTQQIVKSVTAVAKLWHSPDRRPFASIPFDNGSVQHLAIGGSEFRYRISENFRVKTGEFASPRVVKDASEILASIAVIDGEESVPHVRVARQENVIYVDLGDPEWQAVRIDGDGWSVVRKCPIKFVRPSSFAALPVPTEGAGLAELREVLPGMSDESWILVQGFLVGVFDPTGTQPILVFCGGQGSGKSTAVNVIKSLTDPNQIASRSMPRKIDELFVATEHNRVLVFDNVSYLTGEQSDALSQIASGGGMGRRKLFTDSDEVTIETKQPMILNGITDFVSRADLDERCLHVELETIEPKDRMLDSEVSKKLEEIRPRVLASIFHAVSVALSRVGTFRLEERPRLAELAEFVAAAEPALDTEIGEFAAVLQEQSKQRSLTRSEMEPVIVAINRCLGSIGSTGSFSGTYKDLLAQIEEELPQRAGGWTPSKLSADIRRLAPDFLVSGILISKPPRTNRGSRIQITRTTSD